MQLVAKSMAVKCIQIFKALLTFHSIATDVSKFPGWSWVSFSFQFEKGMDELSADKKITLSLPQARTGSVGWKLLTNLPHSDTDLSDFLNFPVPFNVNVEFKKKKLISINKNVFIYVTHLILLSIVRWPRAIRFFALSALSFFQSVRIGHDHRLANLWWEKWWAALVNTSSMMKIQMKVLLFLCWFSSIGFLSKMFIGILKELLPNGCLPRVRK